MIHGNLIRNKIQYVCGGLFITLLIERKLTNNQMGCIQIYICDYALRQAEELPFFHS